MPKQYSSTDWVILITLSALWASAYAFNRLAVNQDAPDFGIPPQAIIAIRLNIAAIILLCVAAASGQKWPCIKDYRSWLIIAAMGVTGTTAPFLVITIAQETIDSSLAALYVAATPFFVAPMAHMLFADEAINWRKACGILVGFVGILVLFGPEAMMAFGSASMMAQALCLAGTIFYAVSTIIARLGKHIPPLIFAASFVSCGAVASWPLLMTVDFAQLAPATSALAGAIGLALGPTAMASILYAVLIGRTSATFLSLNGYIIPILATIIGFLAFQERPGWNSLLAFILILFGVALAGNYNTGKKTAYKEY